MLVPSHLIFCLEINEFRVGDPRHRTYFLTHRRFIGMFQWDWIYNIQTVGGDCNGKMEVFSPFSVT